MMTRIRFFSFLLLFGLLGSNMGYAQEDLEISVTSIDISQFPLISMQVSIRDVKNVLQNPDVGNIMVSEDGQPVLATSFNCPVDSGIRLSFAILLDRSGSMTRDEDNDIDPDSTKMRAAKKAIGLFLDQLGSFDEAAVFSFTTTRWNSNLFSVEHDFSQDIGSLKGSLVPIYADGGTSLWEAVIDAVDELKSRTGKRILILVTDGRNRTRENMRTPAINLAISEGIPVYCIGLGDDLDVDALLNISAATGGRLYIAPTAAELDGIFTQLAGELITDDCNLQYISPNACKDGTTRAVELMLTGGAKFAEADTFYTVSSEIKPVTVAVNNGVSAVAGELLTVPVSIREYFSMSENINYSMTVDYDVSFMQYVGFNIAGTISEGGPVQVDEVTPGSLNISLTGHAPAMPIGTLFELEFLTSLFASDTTTQVSLRDMMVSQLCPTEETGLGGGMIITACEKDFLIASDERLIALDGEVISLPVTVTPSLAAGDFMAVSTRILYERDYLEFVGIDTTEALSTSGSATVVDNGAWLELNVSGVATFETDMLLHLLFRAKAGKIVHVTELDFLDTDVLSDCRTTSSTGHSTVFIDGICEPLLVRVGDANRLANHPNPFNPSTTIRFTVEHDSYTTLKVFNSLGQEMETLIDGWMNIGKYEIVYNAGDIPAGQYLLVLGKGGSTEVRNMIVLK